MPISSLLDPLTIGSVTAPCRVVFGPHETNLGRGRSITDRHVAYYARRAAGGAGVVVTEEASVHPSDWPMERAPLASECAPGWAAVVDACRPHGTVVLAALGHSGGQGTSHWSQRELWAPSRVPEVNTREVPKWMEADDIAAVISGFADGARLAVESGCDGVEVNAGQFSLVRQFLSGLTNQRDDEWGTDRTLFARQVIGAVRSAVGPDAVVALRLSCDELAPWAGVTPEMAAEIAPALVVDDHGEALVDMLTVVRGSIFSAGSTRPDGHTSPGFNLDLTRMVRDAVRAVSGDRVAVLAQGSIVDVDQAEWALGEGMADAVEMTRALIADADLPAKARAGTPERIRPCTLCNQACQVRDNRNPIVTCVVDPRSGHETEDLPVPDGPSATPGTPGSSDRWGVVVIGGGAAGLEAARVAALLGHRATILESSDGLGGTLRTAALLPGRGRFARFADWLESECRRLGVEIRTGTNPDVDDVVAAPHVVVATGGRAGSRTYDVAGDAVPLLSPEEVLEDPQRLPDGGVLVWDPIGGPIGIGVSELLVADGREVHLATPDLIVGNELARAGDLAPANARLAGAGVVLHRRSILRSVDSLGAVLEDRFAAATAHVGVAAVIDAGHRLPDDRLLDELAGHPEAHAVAVGDCIAPRTVLEAVLEGRRAAFDLA